MIYVYVYLGHFAVCLKLTQHSKSTLLQDNFLKFMKTGKKGIIKEVNHIEILFVKII